MRDDGEPISFSWTWLLAVQLFDFGIEALQELVVGRFDRDFEFDLGLQKLGVCAGRAARNRPATASRSSR